MSCSPFVYLASGAEGLPDPVVLQQPIVYPVLSHVKQVLLEIFIPPEFIA